MNKQAEGASMKTRAIMANKLEAATELVESITQDLSTHLANNKEDMENLTFFLDYHKEALYRLRCARVAVELMKEPA